MAEPVDLTDMPPQKKIVEILKAAFKAFTADKGTRSAAALAYYTLFSLVPLLFVILAFAGFFLGSGSDSPAEDCDTATADGTATGGPLDDILEQVDLVAGRTVADQFAEIACSARKSAGASLSIGLAVAAFTASGIFLQIQGVLNGVFRVPDERVEGVVALIRQRVIALISALILAVLLFAPLIAVAVVGVLVDLVPFGLDWLRPVLRLAVPLTSLGVLILVIGGMFQGLTAKAIPWKAAWRGGLLTAVTVIAGAAAVGTYLGGGAASSGTLGAIGGVAILLLFFNLLWIIFVLGAEVTKVYADYLQRGHIGPPPSPTDPPPRPSAEEVRAAATADLIARVGVLSFLAGLVLGWWRRR